MLQGLIDAMERGEMPAAPQPAGLTVQVRGPWAIGWPGRVGAQHCTALLEQHGRGGKNGICTGCMRQRVHAPPERLCDVGRRGEKGQERVTSPKTPSLQPHLWPAPALRRPRQMRPYQLQSLQFMLDCERGEGGFRRFLYLPVGGWARCCDASTIPPLTVLACAWGPLSS